MIKFFAYMGVDGCWCALWSSKPVIAVRNCLGGFDSHILPPGCTKTKSVGETSQDKKEKVAMKLHI